MTECISMPHNDTEEPYVPSESDIEEIKETVYDLIADYMERNILILRYPDYGKRIQRSIMVDIEALYVPVQSYINNINLDDIFGECLLLYTHVFSMPRYHNNFVFTKMREAVDKQLERIKIIPQHVQNSAEWFERRWNLITASSAYKALGSQSLKNSLIYSKCRPIDKSKYTNVNINSATHHGHKFEPLSTIFYERLYNTEISEFGCLLDQYTHILGASPDGINTKRDNDRYGYLLEIKNPVSRKLNGIPKMEYWVQMQFQMHVTQLHHCDFLETVFKQYESEEHFDADGTFSKTLLGKYKGVIVCFHDGIKPVYKYPPWDINKDDFEIWFENIIDESTNLTWINNTYWYLDEYSCVTVLYNALWFKAAMPHFIDIWKIIREERITGYEHRKAKKRLKNPPIVSPIAPTLPEFDIGQSLSLPPPKMVLKIRPSSFDETN